MFLVSLLLLQSTIQMSVPSLIFTNPIAPSTYDGLADLNEKMNLKYKNIHFVIENLTCFA